MSATQLGFLETCMKGIDAFAVKHNLHGAGLSSGSSHNLAETATQPRELGLNFQDTCLES